MSSPCNITPPAWPKFNGLASRKDGTTALHDLDTGATQEFPDRESAYIHIINTLIERVHAGYR